ncbi:anaerobic ribonucleoside-triphosphate reductase activating protein [Candidatus Latescibacterota bacterium]
MERTSCKMHHVPIVGTIPMTMIDYPGKTAAVLFTKGCPWNCRYCHNQTCKDANAQDIMPIDSIETFLDDRVGFLDGIVVSGGEPTIHPTLPVFLERIKGRGYQVALHTNGSNPDMMLLLIRCGLVDFIAMDVKAPPALYERITGYPNAGAKASRSITAILSSGVDYEFRTTYHPCLMTERDLMDTVKAVYSAGGRRYFVQRFQTQGVEDEELVGYGEVSDVPGSIVEEASKLFDVFEVR